MIRLEKIELKTGAQLILDDVSLQLQRGEKVVLKGPSGCGKSTLLKIIAGAIKPSAGRVHFNGDTLSANTVQKIRAAVAFIGQEPACGAETVREALLLPFTFKVHERRAPSEQQIHETLERLYLPANIVDKKCVRISGGEKQRIAIARAFLLNKTIFIADEITSALDPVSKGAVIEELFRPEFTVISASHDPDWLKACGRTIEMKAGQITGDRHADH